MGRLLKNENSTVTGSHNILSVGAMVKGDIFTEESFRIDGSVEGSINSKGKVIIGPQAVINGNIDSVNIEVLGKVLGNIKCSDTLTLRKSGYIKGDISVKTLEVEPGGAFEGVSLMSSTQKNIETEKNVVAEKTKK